MTRPTRIRIRVSALQHNLSQVGRLAPNSRIWAVVKANAYGHGLAAALQGFARADGLALVEFDHALALRRLGWTRPLLMLEGAFDAADVTLARSAGLSLVVHEPRQIDWLARSGDAGSDGASDHSADSRIDVFLKINTGMNRLGFPLGESAAAAARLAILPTVRSVTWMTHFADADGPPGVAVPLARFRHALPHAPVPCSLANSAAILDHPLTHADWVRPGIMLYGASPFAGRSASALGLQPAMHFESRLIGVQSLATGDAVGYGSSFVADRPMRIGVVACGYADGYPRHAGTGAPVAVAGVRTRTVGRVSMDMLTVDLTPVPDAGPGDPVELWGAQIPIDEVAAWAGTIGYELMCAIAPRVAVLVED
jgi:alanine racemase